jgi:hypothetical protein
MRKVDKNIALGDKTVVDLRKMTELAQNKSQSLKWINENACGDPHAKALKTHKIATLQLVSTACRSRL